MTRDKEIFQSLVYFCWFIFTEFGQVAIVLLILRKTLGYEKQSKPSPFDKKNSRITHTICHKMTQHESGWVPQFKNRLRRLNLLLISVTPFADL